ncbi:hypothetical protein FML24_19155 [Klebsiella oxytoca]|uniref:Uncharacterized protein n=1 Tax=Klebsiella oxytoca TaxID=571 RepID=A0AAD3YNT1_KLEOX|nr:hypothetical protein [Klebsiella oxytoca]MBZ6767085.1 hypothetical protein [Klebsiella oxytoca]MBZ6804288.1 hypothetical protein [Klebsiella oxytoca]MBZ7066372.1 hypothetical protein [Klebsiella oxytoca]MBZ7155267.1 hypothetical protein [Klebsiella oxytoca]
MPCGIPGIGLEIEGAIQQAPHSGRHSIIDSSDRLLRPSLNVLPEDSKTHEFRLPERPGASSFTRYFRPFK